MRRQESSVRRGLGYLLRWKPAPLFGSTPATGYHIYSNAGSGPINYASPIATVYTTTWTSGPLTFPDTWMFGVRAFDSGGEELNLDAAVTIILDGNGIDITNRPKPPFATRAFAMAGGAIRVEWSYNTINPSPVPTGFHVYLGRIGVLAPVSPVGGSQIAAAGSVRWIGSPTLNPVSAVSQPGRRDGASSIRWRPGTGGGVDYTNPVATISYQSAIAGSFVANIPGLLNGVTYQVGVRAYNAVAEEPNTTAVTVTADSVGPSAVVSLTAVATA